MENFVSIALLLVVQVAERPRSLPALPVTLVPSTLEDREAPIQHMALAAEPAHQ